MASKSEMRANNGRTALRELIQGKRGATAGAGARTGTGMGTGTGNCVVCQRTVSATRRMCLAHAVELTGKQDPTPQEVGRAADKWVREHAPKVEALSPSTLLALSALMLGPGVGE